MFDRLIEGTKLRVRRKLPDASIRVSGRTVIASEWFQDLDGNSYRLEYHVADGGEQTKVYCQQRPSFWWLFWKKKDYTLHESHLHEDGLICLGSPNVMPIEDAVERARFWANCYTYLIQHGLVETRRLVPEW